MTRLITTLNEDERRILREREDLHTAGAIVRGETMQLATNEQLIAVVALLRDAREIMKAEGLDMSVRHASGVDEWLTKADRVLGKPANAHDGEAR